MSTIDDDGLTRSRAARGLRVDSESYERTTNNQQNIAHQIVVAKLRAKSQLTLISRAAIRLKILIAINPLKPAVSLCVYTLNVQRHTGLTYHS